MKAVWIQFFSILFLTVAAACGPAGNALLPGADVLEFGPENTLFIGDSRQGMVYAVPVVPGEKPEGPASFNFADVDRKLGRVLGLDPRDILIQDLKVHPATQQAYLAVRMGASPDAKSVIAVVAPGSDEIKLLDVSGPDVTSVELQDLASGEITFWEQ